MAIPRSKSELVAAIETSYSKLSTELKEIPENKTSITNLDGHAKDSKMSVENLVAYLIGWGVLVLKWNSKISKGETVNFPEDHFSWNQLGELAQKFYENYDDLNFVELTDKLDFVVATILELIQSKTNEELYQVNWYKNYSMGRMIQLNTSSPYKNARARIRKWKKNLMQ